MHTDFFLSSMEHGVTLGAIAGGEGSSLEINERADINMYQHRDRL